MGSMSPYIAAPWILWAFWWWSEFMISGNQLVIRRSIGSPMAWCCPSGAPRSGLTTQQQSLFVWNDGFFKKHPIWFFTSSLPTSDHLFFQTPHSPRYLFSHGLRRVRWKKPLLPSSPSFKTCWPPSRLPRLPRLLPLPHRLPSAQQSRFWRRRNGPERRSGLVGSFLRFQCPFSWISNHGYHGSVRSWGFQTLLTVEFPFYFPQN